MGSLPRLHSRNVEVSLKITGRRDFQEVEGSDTILLTGIFGSDSSKTSSFKD